MVIAIKYLEVSGVITPEAVRTGGGAGEATSVKAVTQEVTTAAETIIGGADAVYRADAEDSNTMETKAENVTPVEAIKDVSSAEAIGESGVKIKAAENDAMLEDAAEGRADLETAAGEAVTTKAVGASEEEAGQAVTDAQGGGDLSWLKVRK